MTLSTSRSSSKSNASSKSSSRKKRRIAWRNDSLVARPIDARSAVFTANLITHTSLYSTLQSSKPKSPRYPLVARVPPPRPQNVASRPTPRSRARTTVRHHARDAVDASNAVPRARARCGEQSGLDRARARHPTAESARCVPRRAVPGRRGPR